MNDGKLTGKGWFATENQPDSVPGSGKGYIRLHYPKIGDALDLSG
jgi:hypothetical protein